MLWKRELDDRDEEKRKGNMSSPSPVTDGERVWAVTGTGVIKAFDFAGDEKWTRDLQAEYGKFGILHGYSSSPLLHDGALYVQVLHGFYTDDPSYVLAIDAATGATRWRIERPTDAPREAPDAYTTPALLERDTGAELVVSGADYVTGHDLATGKELWRVGGLNPTANPMQRIVASPVVSGDLILVPSRVKPMLALSAAEPGAPKVIWSSDDGPDVPTPVVTDDYVFVLKDRGILFCLDRHTGEVVWGPERVDTAVYSASPLVADGKLYVTSEEGTTTVLAAAPEFEVLAENIISENTLASQALSQNRLLLRTSDALYCLSAGRGRSSSRLAGRQPLARTAPLSGSRARTAILRRLLRVPLPRPCQLPVSRVVLQDHCRRQSPPGRQEDSVDLLGAQVELGLNLEPVLGAAPNLDALETDLLPREAKARAQLHVLDRQEIVEPREPRDAVPEDGGERRGVEKLGLEPALDHSRLGRLHSETAGQGAGGDPEPAPPVARLEAVAGLDPTLVDASGCCRRARACPPRGRLPGTSRRPRRRP